MTIHLHDLARAMHDEADRTYVAGIDDVAETTRKSLRSIIGTTLIRAGTRLVPERPERRRMQSVPPC